MLDVLHVVSSHVEMIVLCVGIIVDMVCEDCIIWFQIFNVFSLFFLFFLWVDSLILYLYLQISLCQLRSLEALHLQWTLLLLILERIYVCMILWFLLRHVRLRTLGDLSINSPSHKANILTRLSIYKIAIYSMTSL